MGPLVRIMLFYWINTLAGLYVFGYRTAPTRAGNALEWFNEFCFWLMLVHLMVFTDFVGDRETKYVVGYAIISIVSLNIGINMLITF